jgi:hypothetical protein
MRVVARHPLHEHEPRLSRKAVLARVIRKRDTRFQADPIELVSEPQRRRKADRPGLPVAQTNRRHRRHNRTARGRHVRKRRGEVPTDDFVIETRPHVTTLPKATAPVTRATTPSKLSARYGEAGPTVAITARTHACPIGRLCREGAPRLWRRLAQRVARRGRGTKPASLLTGRWSSAPGVAFASRGSSPPFAEPPRRPSRTGRNGRAYQSTCAAGASERFCSQAKQHGSRARAAALGS